MAGAMRATRPGSPVERACSSVSVRPGETAFTRMPSLATSFESPSVMVSTAPLAGERGGASGDASGDHHCVEGAECLLRFDKQSCDLLGITHVGLYGHGLPAA